MVNPIEARISAGWNAAEACVSMRAGVAQMVEHRPSKPIVAGSIPVARSSSMVEVEPSPARFKSSQPGNPERDLMVDVAQLVELRIVDPAAVGSSPIIHPKLFPAAAFGDPGMESHHICARSSIG